MAVQRGGQTAPRCFHAELATARLEFRWPVCLTLCNCPSQQVTSTAITKEERGP